VQIVHMAIIQTSSPASWDEDNVFGFCGPKPVEGGTFRGFMLFRSLCHPNFSNTSSPIQSCYETGRAVMTLQHKWLRWKCWNIQVLIRRDELEVDRFRCFICNSITVVTRVRQTSLNLHQVTLNNNKLSRTLRFRTTFHSDLSSV
jgi:hypothetical protein